MGKTGGKAISFFGLVAMGIGCMLGTSWLLLTGTWLDTAGGPLNLAVAFLLCIIIELPFAFAYMEAIPMFPLPGGEVVYSYAAFGPRGGFAVGWAGILMNTIVFCWVDLAAISLLDELFPALKETAVLYHVGDFPVTLPNLILQLLLAGAILWVQIKGANVCASLAKIATVVLLVMCAVGLAVCFAHFDPAVYAAEGGMEFDFAGSASLLSLLVFSVAGWETVSKAAADATGPAARKAGAALITCLILVTGILCLVSTAVAGCMPWTQAVGRTAPFADVLVSITGLPWVRLLFLVTAFVGAVGVMNSTLYSSAQMLYGLSRFALVSRKFAVLHPKYGTPVRCICFTAAFVVLTPFTGKLFFIPFINVASLTTIVMWVMSFVAVLWLRKTRSGLRRPVSMPGGKVTAVFGVLASVFLAGNILLPMSPGALGGLEYGLAVVLAALGWVLYQFRDRSVGAGEQERLIFGDLLAGELPATFWRENCPQPLAKSKKNDILVPTEVKFYESREMEMERTKIAQIFADQEQFGGKEITVCGWARTIRDMKSFGFVELNDGSCFKNLQVVLDANVLDNYKEIAGQNVGAALIVTGTVVLTPEAKQPLEIKASKIQVEGTSTPDYPLQKKRHSVEYLRTIQHLRPRTNLFSATFRVRSVAAHAIHCFFQDRGFVYAQTPLITASDCEGAGEMFQVTTLDLQNVPKNEDGTVDYTKDFFGKKANLTVSGQLNAENFAMAFGNVYTFGPTFRAENSNTQRHAAEFWMIEPEMAFADLNDYMDTAEAMIKYIINTVMEKCPDEMNFFSSFVDKGLKERLEHVANSDFGRITYTEAVELLKQNNDKFDYKVEWGCDLQTEHERYLTEQIFKRPVFVTDYPKDIKAFYMRLNDDGKTVAAADCLVPGIGEIIGGSQREERLELLESRIKELGMNPEDYWWYLDLRRYGSCRHAGFGLGFERMVMYLTGVSNIRDVELHPRTVGNADF